jgi:type I restriction-modification system DNA methylase subunit
VDASDFKTFIFPLLFFKHISDGFLRQRATALLSLVERATGKQVTGQDSDEAKAAFGGSLVGQTQE